MLVVKIELWPHGQKKKRKEIGRMYIGNDGTGSPMRGNYDVYVCSEGQTEPPPDGAYARAGRVEQYPRQGYTVWQLIKRALNAVYP